MAFLTQHEHLTIFNYASAIDTISDGDGDGENNREWLVVSLITTPRYSVELMLKWTAPDWSADKW